MRSIRAALFTVVAAAVVATSIVPAAEAQAALPDAVLSVTSPTTFEEGYLDAPITFTGSGFTPNAQVSVDIVVASDEAAPYVLTGTSLPANSTGELSPFMPFFAQGWIIPATGGEHNSRVYLVASELAAPANGNQSRVSNQVDFTVTERVMLPAATIVVPNTIVVAGPNWGEGIAFTGSGWSPNSTVYLMLELQIDDISGAGDHLELVSDANGNISGVINPAANSDNPSPVAPGEDGYPKYRIYALEGSFGEPIRESNSVVITVTTNVSTPPTPAVLGTGAVSIKGPSSELLPGVTVEIRKNTCSGPAVWYTTTTDRADAYGAFGIGLQPGQYCIKTLNVPAPYWIPADVMFTMEERPANWVTVWVPGPIVRPIVTGALVAKDANGNGVNGVTALIQEGPCGVGGPGVWQNTTASSRWASGGFGISLATGTHCVTTQGVPAGYRIPAPVQIDVVAPSPMWITVWVASQPLEGSGDSVVPADFYSGQKIVDFSCPSCTGYTGVWALDQDGKRDLLVSTVGAYQGRRIAGFTDYFPVHYTGFEITANAHWTMTISNISSARHVSSTAVGMGDDVVVFDSPGTVANISHTGGGYFGVWSRDSRGDMDLLANEIGSYWGSVSARSPATMQITADGTWQISVG
ncbi:hypothetical protein [Microbacterium lacus]|uniref:hypothetical protein n=1 Tax=Microbacterium lacus TaxID=415217 RepID=UPI0012FDD719|nr:hypothetical protein [Microbacterium lacus]